MFGSTKHTEGSHEDMRSGTGFVYVVTDNVDDVYARARAAGVDVLREL